MMASGFDSLPPRFSGVPAAASRAQDAGFFRWFVDETGPREPELHPAPPRAQPAHRPRVGDWDLLGRIGGGTSADVYLAARRTQPEHRVALKVLKDPLQPDPGRRAAFRVEQEIAWRLRHPALPRAFQTGESEGVDFLVSERILGWTWADLLLHTIAARRPLPQSVLLDLGVQLADALAWLHEQRLTHGDLRPENVLLTVDGRVKLVDFGGASRSDAVHAFQAPEQLDGAPASPATEAFVLGTLLATLTLPRCPFDDASSLRSFDSRALARELRERVPALAPILVDCLDPDPSKRPDALEVRTRLSRERSSADAARRWVGQEEPRLPPLPGVGTWGGEGPPEDLRATFVEARLVDEEPEAPARSIETPR